MKAERLGSVLYEMTTQATTANGHSKAALDSFVEYIHARGYAKLLPRILAEYERLGQSAKQSSTLVTMAKKRDLKDVLAAHGIEENVETRIDETIVGGYTIETDSRFIDASHKNALIRLYQTLTH